MKKNGVDWKKLELTAAFSIFPDHIFFAINFLENISLIFKIENEEFACFYIEEEG